jgi:hypothetical protein
MQKDSNRSESDITEAIIGAAFEIANVLAGCGKGLADERRLTTEELSALIGVCLRFEMGS